MGFLAEIVHENEAKIRAPDYVAALPARPRSAAPSFRAAVERDRDRGALVVEYKRVSPGRPEPVLPERSVARFVELVGPAAPTALSCLATIPRFDGSPSDVRELATAAALPVLFKDFVVAERQIEVAARTGAGAVLLIARLATEGLLRAPLSALADSAHRHGLEVVLEYHSRAELSRVGDVPADVYGVNVRDLNTLRLDPSTAQETIRAAREAGLHPLLGLSGVESPSDAQRFWEQGVDGILVGSAVARSPDPAGFLSTLRRDRNGGSR